MFDTLKELIKQPYWVIALIVGALLITFPCVTIDKDNHFSAHPPNTVWPMRIGLGLCLLSAIGFLFTLSSQRAGNEGAGLDLTRVNEHGGEFWTNVSGCEVRVANGRVEDHSPDQSTAIVLPCNEYFDDRCVDDARSSLGAYVNRIFQGQVPEFVNLMKNESGQKLGPGREQQKTTDIRAQSLGAGRCVLIIRPLGRAIAIALVSTTTQRAGEGLATRISYLFDGMRELVKCLADARLSEVVMPVLGAGKGGIDPPLAFVGLVLAVAEAARYGQGAQRLKKVTIVVFKSGEGKPPEVDPVVVRRALALISSGI
jgi:hypothetical protein